nr:HBL/NHE enterotoxin family protein [Priestia taiwanensis]
MPQGVLAEEMKPKQVSAHNVINTKVLSNSIRTLGSQSPLIQAYGLVILQQPDVQVKAMSSLTNHQKIARNNVKEWLDEYNPRLIDVNEDMMRFSTRFNSYYNKLYELAGKVNEDEQAKADFLQAFSRLHTQVRTVQEKMTQTSHDLASYQTLLLTDNKTFSERAEMAIQSLQGTNGEVIQLRADIKKLQDEIQTELTNILNSPNDIVKGSIKIGKTLSTIAKNGAETQTLDIVSVEQLGGDIVSTANNQASKSAAIIAEKQKALLPLVKKLSEIELEVTGITLIEDQVDGFTEMINRQTTVFGHVMKDWKSINETMEQIEMDFEAGLVNGTSLQKQVMMLKKMSDEINKQTNQYQDFVTNIEVK